MRGVIAASSKRVRRAASAGGVSDSSFPNGDTRRRATNDVNATPGAKFRAGHQKHHSAVGHLDSRPAPHYKQVLTRPIVNSSLFLPDVSRPVRVHRSGAGWIIEIREG